MQSKDEFIGVFIIVHSTPIACANDTDMVSMLSMHVLFVLGILILQIKLKKRQHGLSRIGIFQAFMVLRSKLVDNVNDSGGRGCIHNRTGYNSQAVPWVTTRFHLLL